MTITVRVYKPRYPTAAQLVPALLAAATWGFSTTAILSGRYIEINPLWAAWPVGPMLITQAIAIGMLAATLWWLADEYPFIVLTALPWAAVFVHDVVVVIT